MSPLPGAVKVVIVILPASDRPSSIDLTPLGAVEPALKSRTTNVPALEQPSPRPTTSAISGIHAREPRRVIGESSTGRDASRWTAGLENPLGSERRRRRGGRARA